MICKGCGAELAGNQLFCPHCGQKNEAAGMNSTKKCVKCGKEFTDDRLYCDVCGGEVVAVVPSQGSNVNPAIPSRVIPNQVNPNAMPQSFGQMNSMPPQYQAQNQMPAGLMPQNNMQPNMGPSGPMPQNNMQPNMGPKGPMPQNGMQPNPGPMGQMPPYPMVAGNYQPNRVPPNMVPPINPYIQNPPKKKNIALPIILAIVGVIVIVGGILIAARVISSIKDKAKEEIETTIDSEGHNDDTDIVEDDTDITEDDTDTSEDTTQDDTDQDSSTDGTAGDTLGDYNYLYSYTELPDVVSMDSDSRFTSYDYYSYDGVPTYTFQYNDPSATDTDFYSAVGDYCTLVMNANGFNYDADFNDEQADESGELTEYLTKDNVCIGVTASVEDTGYYAYIAVYNLGDQADTGTDINFKNYTDYVEGRDSQYFDLETEVLLDSGLAFYLNSCTLYDQGDGTAILECNMDLGSTQENWSFYPDDVMVLPMDSNGNILSDVCMVNTIKDNTSGSEVEMPLLLDDEYYNNYTVSFVVPADTETFTVYGTNITEDSFAGPIYYIDMELE